MPPDGRSLELIDSDLRDTDERLDQLITYLRTQFERLEQQAGNPNETPAGREVLVRLGRLDQQGAKLREDVDRLNAWRDQLASEYRATLRTVRLLGSFIVGVVGFLGVLAGLVWALHNLGVIH